MGLPLIHTGNISDPPPEQQPLYEAILADAARETGNLFLADGDIVRAWPCFRAIGDAAPKAEAKANGKLRPLGHTGGARRVK
jgi:hypothetical protein